MNKFWDLVEKSTITSSALALMLAGTISYCVIAQVPVPDFIIAAFSVVIGFFFSSKLKDEANRAISVERDRADAEIQSRMGVR